MPSRRTPHRGASAHQRDEAPQEQAKLWIRPHVLALKKRTRAAARFPFRMPPLFLLSREIAGLWCGRASRGSPLSPRPCRPCRSTVELRPEVGCAQCTRALSPRRFLAVECRNPILTRRGEEADLVLKSSSPFPWSVLLLRLHVRYDTDNRLRGGRAGREDSGAREAKVGVDDGRQQQAIIINTHLEQ